MIHFSSEVWALMSQLGGICVALWVGINIVGALYPVCVNYVNENTKAVNPCPWWGWIDAFDGFLKFLGTLIGSFGAFVIPFVILGIISIYPVPLFILTTYGVLRIARGAKRISRKLTAHTVDPEAHKNA